MIVRDWGIVMKKSSNEKIDINRITPNADYGLTDKQVENIRKMVGVMRQ